MKCHKCKKNIDLEMTLNEEKLFVKEMKDHEVILLCIECGTVTDQLLTETK